MQAVRFRAELLRDHQFLGELTDAGMLGLIEDDGSVRVFFEDGQEVSELQVRYGGVLEAAGQAGTEASAGGAHESVLLGARFAVMAPGDEAAAPDGREAIRMEAGVAFGSGRHETTQLVVEALEEMDLDDSTVLDVGSGSGLVAEVARRLGARSTVACDIYYDSLAVARRQFGDLAQFCGSVDAIAHRAVDVVVANITAAVVDRLAEELVRVLRPGGVLVLSGFVFEAVPSRFTPLRVMGRGDWLCWICQGDSLLPSGEGEQARPLQPFEQQWW